ncbi:MAG: polyribonucleotide nucleotidyltransferase [Caldilineaceae bacterium]|nr:polyribonucleotide nucleotidyltransferase [Caldilineaceae bacterium]MBP8106196.1 polyribonucleotide nucleotidyltransferase [Caldilineaceae bacterium]MBP8121127.1 polyribonucleotide nucleotidyltransferase [Caldilineaceae bacterium]MBP9071520.1 polyribonucleotide nucleotidyltransferase [Caldilineaceae bacterium]
MVGGRELSIETGVLAGLAGGAVTVRYGDTVLLATATMGKDVRPGINFFPMSVEFEEKLYAGGRIPGSFFRREARPTEGAILLCRLVDRPLRPLFPKGMRNEVQVIVSTLAVDGETLMDPLAIIAASAALSISDIPWNGPVAGTSVGYVDGEFVINPTASQMLNSTLDLKVGGTADNILMVEAGANELPEDDVLEALKLAHEAMQPVIELIKTMQAEVGKTKVTDFPVFLPPAEVKALVADMTADKVAALAAQSPDKTGWNDGLDAIKKDLLADLADRLASNEIQERDVADGMDSVVKNAVRRRILDTGIRPDGRDTLTVRPISVQVGKLPMVHGSGLFQRGETQVLTVATLGTPGDAQRLDGLQPGSEKRYIHHYNFPPFSTGEAYPMRGPKRREIGHGALAERALIPVLPENYPYTLRLVSEALSSNGSTSMASVCGSTLSLMDAGVPILAPVAGIAMGLIQDQETGAYQVLTDIQGMEDHLGDMDFKVAGTEHGITALQMDMKIKGLDFSILKQALEQARVGRLFILGKMLAVMPAPRAELSPYAPRILTTTIDPEKIGKIIGPGGKVIRAMQEQFKVKIDVDDDGTVYVSGSDGRGAEAALAQIKSLTEEVEVGKIYTGTVVRVEPYGAFVNILPGTDGLVHISQLADYRVNNVEEIANVGDELTAMVIDVDPSGKVRLSRQAVLEGWTAEEAREKDKGGRRTGGSDRGGDRDRRGGSDRGGDRGGNRGGGRDRR